MKAIKSDADDVDDACDDPEIVKLMVDYFYSFDYLPDAEERVRRATPHGSLFLKELVDELIMQQESEENGSTVDDTSTKHNQPPKLQNFIVEHAKIFAMAVKYQIDGLRDLAVQKFDREMNKSSAHHHDNFAQALSIVYTSTPDDMKQLRSSVELALDYFYEHLIRKDDIKAVISSTPQLSFALLELSRQSRRRNFKPLFRVCATCHKNFPSTHEGGPGSNPTGYTVCSNTCGRRSAPVLDLTSDDEFLSDHTY